MKKLISLLFLLGTVLTYSQTSIYKTETASIQFDVAKTTIEPIKAKNTKAKIILDSKTGEIACLINMIDFSFPNKLMQEHFNENYMESDKYPTATFSGTIEKISEVDFSEEQKVKASGIFTIHGKKHKKEIDLYIQKTNKRFHLKSNFTLQLKDFKIKIPKIMFYKIAEEVEVSLWAELNN